MDCDLIPDLELWKSPNRHVERNRALGQTLGRSVKNAGGILTDKSRNQITFFTAPVVRRQHARGNGRNHRFHSLMRLTAKHFI